MLVEGGGELYPMVMLSQLQTIMVAADRLSKFEEKPEDLVIWPNPSSRQLNNATIRRRFESALDIACGSGVTALTLAHHTKTVTATDINPRALIHRLQRAAERIGEHRPA